MQKTIDKIDQLIELHTTMGRKLAANKLKEIKDEVVEKERIYNEISEALQFFVNNNMLSIIGEEVALRLIQEAKSND
jgi:hypothetical protein